MSFLDRLCKGLSAITNAYGEIRHMLIMDAINDKVNQLSRVVSRSLRYYSLFVILSTSIFAIATLFFIMPFAVTQVIASILFLILSLSVVILLIAIPIVAYPYLSALPDKLEQLNSLRISYGSYVDYGIHSAISKFKEHVPKLVILTVIQIGVLVLCLFIMRKTVLKSVEDVGILKLLIFPFTHSFDTIFRTGMSEALFGPF